MNDFDEFETYMYDQYGQFKNYSVSRKVVNGIPRTRIGFEHMRWPIEIFGQPVPTINQNGYRHMVIEARLLEIFGDSFRHQIIDLKSNGMKTEPAFAQLLKLEGNPYEAILRLNAYTDEEIKKMWVDQADVV